MRSIYLSALASCVIASPAAAAVVYSNNFDAENGGNTALNYNSFNGLNVTNGTVDLVKSGDFGIICAGGSGSCVDLDGSTGDSGLTSSGSYAFNAGDRVAISYLWSGNQRGGSLDSFRTRFEFNGVMTGTRGIESTLFGNQNYGAFSGNSVGINISNIPASQAMTDMTFYFIAGSAGTLTFSFEDFGNDNVGVIIDNLSLDIAAVPEPSSWALLILGFGAVGAAARRRRTSSRVAIG